MAERILVVAAHPDDEVLGCGGTVAKMVAEGGEAYCLFLGEGATSREGSSKKEVQALREEAKKAAKVLGFKEVFFSSFPDNRFDSVDLLDIVKEVEKFIGKTKPDIIFTNWENDLNIDHLLTFKAVETACRPCSNNCPRRIYSFEVLSSTEWKSNAAFVPNVFVDVSGTMGKKKKAMQEYASELKEWSHSRSIEGIEALAKFRGMQSGFLCAEAFVLVRERL